MQLDQDVVIKLNYVDARTPVTPGKIINYENIIWLTRLHVAPKFLGLKQGKQICTSFVGASIENYQLDTGFHFSGVDYNY